jgi:hypothetical protein
MEEAFREGAGFLAQDLRYFIRAVIASLITLWAAWALYNQFKLTVSKQITLGQWLFNGIATVITLTMVLIMVGT